MSDEKRKLAILDCDNCLLNYTKGFREFCEQVKGYEWVDSHEYDLMTYLPNTTCSNEVRDLVIEFNESLRFGMLYPTSYTKVFIAELIEQGYKLCVMSSFTTPSEPFTQKYLRTQNLHEHFGSVFDYYEYLPLGVSKKDLVSIYCDNFDEVLFIDDSPKVLEEIMSIEVGNLTVKAWDQSYNRHLEGVDRISVKTFIEEE